MGLAVRLIALIPAPLHRAALARLQPVRLRLWGLLRREVGGTMVLGFASDGRLVMVRHSYHLPDQWMVPGGGRQRGETVTAAAAREMAEEAGMTLHAPRHVGSLLRQMREGWTNRIEVVAGAVSGEPRADGREIVEVGLFAREALPANTNEAVHLYLRCLDQNGSVP